MKYLGEKSLSSFLYRFIQVVWYFTLVVSILVIVFGTTVLFVIPADAPCLAKVAQRMRVTPAQIKNLHIILKILIIPYIAAVAVLLLIIIKKAQRLFDNFRKNIVFKQDNVSLLTKISKLLIVFSILTFKLGTLISSLFLLVLCAIFKNGTALKEEHDLTV